LSNSTNKDNSWVSSYDWHKLRDRNLEVRGQCGGCDDPVGRAHYPDWVMSCCGKALPSPPVPTPEDKALYDAHLEKVEREYEELKDRQLQRAGAGDWGKGHDIFQLPLDCPDRVVHSQSEMKAVYKKYGLDADSHRFKPGQGPGSENQRRRDGAVSLDNHDRDLGY
jgi:hypothetical protein